MEKINEKRIGVEDYFRARIGSLEQEGRHSTSRNYRKTLACFTAFTGDRPVCMSDIDRSLVRDYNLYLAAQGCAPNSVSFYNRVLRSAFNKAVHEGYSEQTFPFSGAYTGVSETKKRSLGVPLLRKILEMDLQGEPEMDFSRDLFLFSFFARGMCFIDIAYLKQSDIKQGAICYLRKKTRRTLTVQLEPGMLRIMEKWSGRSFGSYVFPVIRSDDPREAFEQYEYRLTRHNLLLKSIGERAGLSFPLSSYAARHSWATLARDLNVPLSVISSAMGHTTERTTRIYIASLENSEIDKANRRVISILESL